MDPRAVETTWDTGGRAVRRLVALGDSTTVGLGDPRPGGGWRGFPALLADALGGAGKVRLANLSFTGARVGCVRTRQLPTALRFGPDAAVLVVGMNDTMRADFDPVRLHDDLDAVIGRLALAGAVVATVRFHNHGRVFRLPGPLRRALWRRIEELNSITDVVVARHGARCVDLHTTPGTYDTRAWSVDRLHPSELGHRMLARGFAEQFAAAGCAVPRPVSLACAGGARVTGLHHAGWLVVKGVPWLWRRGRDLVPYAVSMFAREWLRGQDEQPAPQWSGEALTTPQQAPESM
ncbi:SGNH hydrolase [Longimycelium tulufanense]|uniref:SGNH hydrolase n=1 Tax=Longimycelium tulufanense TaxID=907463 RepID=A0A8J3CI34_9PSEU|nr:SGNH/GDSL hydrolase family protein [Longimycelium tulufanense]GGM72478.1 SGNH hydrolase [Longimycelium tulufanense]